MILAPNLGTLDGLRHAFFTRQGGVSEGPFESLNCGFSSGDDPDRVRANRARAMQRIGASPESLTTARQVHGADVLTVEQAASGRPAIAADALVTGRPGIALGVLSADCAPVLFADPEARVIGAAHAGWRGALAGVLEATIGAMIGLGAERARICAAIGPCIAQDCYEVGPEFFDEFSARDVASEAFFVSPDASGRRRFDLEGYALARLARAGIADPCGLGEDTFADPARFFSSRRTRRQGGQRFGLLLSAIVLDR